MEKVQKSRRSRRPARGEHVTLTGNNATQHFVHPGFVSRVQDRFLGEQQDTALGEGFHHLGRRARPKGPHAATVVVHVAGSLDVALRAEAAHAGLPHLEGHAESGSFQALEGTTDGEVLRPCTLLEPGMRKEGDIARCQ